MHLKMNICKSRMFCICLKMDNLVGCDELPGKRKHEEKGREMMARGSSESKHYPPVQVTPIECNQVQKLREFVSRLCSLHF